MTERFSDDSIYSSLELKTLLVTFEYKTISLIVSRPSCLTDLIGLRYEIAKHMKMYLLNLPQQADNEYI